MASEPPERLRTRGYYNELILLKWVGGGADYALHIVSLSLPKKNIPATLFLDYGVTDLLARYIIELAEQHPQQSGETTNAGHYKNLLISGLVGYLGPSLYYISILFNFLDPTHPHHQHK